jgi:hypothetical protein
VKAPTVTFVTRICHPNVRWETGEVCLDLLGEGWSPVLGVCCSLPFLFPHFPSHFSIFLDMLRFSEGLGFGAYANGCHRS